VCGVAFDQFYYLVSRHQLGFLLPGLFHRQYIAMLLLLMASTATAAQQH
jgi:hypothetical protein